MATALRKILSETGTRHPSSARTPSAKAMSVAAGIAQPRRVPAPDWPGRRPGGRHRHAAERREAGQDPVRPGAQLPVERLALDLQPDQQEEPGHQAVVDPVLHAHRPEGGVERVRVGLGERPVGDDEGQGGRRHQDQPARRLAGEQRADDRERAPAPLRRLVGGGGHHRGRPCRASEAGASAPPYPTRTSAPGPRGSGPARPGSPTRPAPSSPRGCSPARRPAAWSAGRASRCRFWIAGSTRPPGSA